LHTLESQSRNHKTLFKARANPIKLYNVPG
jgi:hypothetical protein